MIKKIYAIGNAHLDPVWMWRWQEGSAEAKATVRSALDRMKEYPEFKFVCSSASIYKWIEEFDPDMFEEIKERVKEGRFIIVGGWFVQPDCNLPSGEGFARQSLYSQRYFYDRFGVTAKVGYNVDSFGHNVMLPQILKKSGMDQYIFMRPSPIENPLKDNLFNWVSPDGSSVLTCRIIAPYCFRFNTKMMLRTRIKMLQMFIPKQTSEMMLFYGVGNHGGGPTKRNIEVISAYNKKHNDLIEFADPLSFFNDIREKGYQLSEWHDDLQHHASGCYSAVSMIKRLNRQGEMSLSEAETMNAMSTLWLGREFPNKQIEQAWEGVCFNHFHDIMGGCAIYDAYVDAERLGNESISIANRLSNNAAQSLSWAIDTSDRSTGIPVVIFNPHPFPVRQAVIINKQFPYLKDIKGRHLPVQFVQSQTYSCQRRYDVLAYVDLPAFGYTTYFIPKQKKLFEMVPHFGRIAYSIRNFRAFRSVTATEKKLENKFLKVKFSERGDLLEIYDKVNGRKAVRASRMVVIDESAHDTWSHGKNYFEKYCGSFTSRSFEIIENGIYRATVKTVSSYQSSKLTQYFTLYAESDTLLVKSEIDWHEKHKMCKLEFDIDVENPRAFYEVPFGVIERPVNGEEEPHLSWTAVKEGDNAYGVAIINDSKNSSSIRDTRMSLTAVRSPLYGDHGGPRNSESQFTDQGAHTFTYGIMPVVGDGWNKVVKEARKLNIAPVIVIENNHEGHLPLTDSMVECDAENVLISAVKRSEDGTGWIIRAYETDGKATDAIIKFGDMPELKWTFTPFSMETFKLEDGGKWRKVMLTEFDYEKAEDANV